MSMKGIIKKQTLPNMGDYTNRTVWVLLIKTPGYPDELFSEYPNKAAAMSDARKYDIRIIK